MTTFDALGLPIFETADKIAASNDGLLQDLNLLGASARNAISAEGARAEGAAKSYTDGKDASNRAAWAAADTADRAAWAAADAARLAEAKAYADGQDTEQDGRLDNFGTRVDALETLGGLAPGDVTDATMTSVAAQADSSFAVELAGKFVGRGRQVLFAPDEGVAGDNYATDDTAAMNALGVRARAEGKRIVVPPWQRIRITGPVDWRYIDVQCDGFVRVDPFAGYGILVGDSSNVRVSRTVSFKSVLHLDAATQTGQPCVRVMGLMGGNVTMGRCDYLQLYANSTTEPVTGKSIAYGTYTFTGGSIRHLELYGEPGQSWINENLFLGGDFRKISFVGTYSHNSNTFIKPSIEGADSLLDIQTGSRNKFLNARGEYNPTVRFGAGTWQNIVQDGFTSNPQNRAAGFVVEYDNGVENIVSAAIDAHLRPYTLVKIDATTDVFDTARSYAGASVTPGLKYLAPAGSFQSVLNSGVVSLQQGGAWLRRFEIRSDATIWRPRAYFYDANMNPLDISVTGQLIDTSGGWVVSAGNDYYGFNSSVASATVLITSTVPKYMRLEVQSGGSSTGLPFEWLRVAGFTTAPNSPTLIESWRAALRAPLFGTTPTKGAAKLGTVIQTATAEAVCTARSDTTLGATAASGATSLTLTSGAGITTGDVIGVLLANGLTHWATVSAITGTAVTLSAAIPAAGAANGAPVVTNRWATR